MARPPRIQFADASYHVYNRGNRREAIFRSPDDYQAFEGFMLDAMNRSGIQLFDWSQMPNHFHFNLATPDGNLADFMQRLLSRYSRYFNRTHALVGHLFQSRYAAKLVDRDAYFMELVRYVELNPYRVKSGPLAELGRWRWSSLHYLLQPSNTWPEGCRNAFARVLAAFHPDAAQARQQLLKFLADGLASGAWEDFYRPKEGRFIGDESFVEKAKTINREPLRAPLRTIDAKIRLDDVLNIAVATSGLSANQLISRGQSRVARRWRQALIVAARRYCRVPRVELARRLGCSESSISMVLARVSDNLERLHEVQQLVVAMEVKSANL